MLMADIVVKWGPRTPIWTRIDIASMPRRGFGDAVWSCWFSKRHILPRFLRAGKLLRDNLSSLESARKRDINFWLPVSWGAHSTKGTSASDKRLEQRLKALTKVLQDRHLQMTDLHASFEDVQTLLDSELRGILEQLTRAQARKVEFLQSVKRQVWGSAGDRVCVDI